MKFYEISDCSDGFMKSDTEVKNAYNFKFYDYMEDESVQWLLKLKLISRICWTVDNIAASRWRRSE